MRSRLQHSLRVSPPPSIHRFFSAVTITSAVLLTANLALAQQDARDDLSPLFQQAAEDFRPVTDEGLADARAELLRSMAALERFVRPASPNGERWLRYLRWDALRETLETDDPPQPGPLAATYRRLNQDEIGLELPQFRRVSDDLRWYSSLLHMAQQPDQERYFRAQLDRLQTQLDEYRSEPTATTGVEIGSRLGFIAGLGEAPELVAAVRREFARPNALLTVATPLIAAGAGPIDRRETVHDVILSARIRSDAHTIGRVGVASIPAQDKAVLEFVSGGQTRSLNVGRSGPAVIHSSSLTDFTAVKRVELSDALFIARSAHANARTHSNIHSVAKAGGGLGSHLVATIGRRRAEQDRSRADAIASGRAQGRIARQFNDELNRDLREVRDRYEDEYRGPLARRGEMPEHIRFSSDRDSIGVEVTQASVGQLAAPGLPPEAPVGHDLTMRMHESAMNNYAAILLAGVTASETEPDDLRFDVKLPQWLRDTWEQSPTRAADEAETEFRPWSLRFRDVRPVSVVFADGEVRITLHIARLTSGDRTFTNWDVTSIYTPELIDGGIVLRRHRDLEMLPADFIGTLTPRQVAERRSLEEEMNLRAAQGRGLAFSMEFDPLELEGDMVDVGPLDTTEFISAGGWLTLTWDRQQKGGLVSR